MEAEASSFAANAQITFTNPDVSENTFKANHNYAAGGQVVSGPIEFRTEGGKIISIELRIIESGVDDEQFAAVQEPIGTPIGKGTSLAELDAGWTPLYPGGETTCALGTPYSFWVRPGPSEKLLIFLQGGGFCNSAETCQLGSITYDSMVSEGDSPGIHQQGIFDLHNPENPFAEYSMVFIPYCTGDTHMGNIVQIYEATDGSELAVSHLGFVNVSAALSWVYDNFEVPESIFLTGCSAGSVGSVMHVPYFI